MELGTPGKLDRSAVARRLREVRLHCPVSREELAARVGCPPYNLGRYERGENLPPVGLLLSLSQALRTSLDFLVAGEPAVLVRDPRLYERFRRADALSPERREELIRLLDTALPPAEPPADPGADR
jgi:transcriptional regulator with XRE-family HTH domain